MTFPSAYLSLFFGRPSRFKHRDNDPSTPLSSPIAAPYVSGTFYVPALGANVSTSLGHSELHGIRSAGRVVTVAGQMQEGSQDGEGGDSRFNGPEGVSLRMAVANHTVHSSCD